jgi:hypothetical protein
LRDGEKSDSSRFELLKWRSSNQEGIGQNGRASNI